MTTRTHRTVRTTAAGMALCVLVWALALPTPTWAQTPLPPAMCGQATLAGQPAAITIEPGGGYTPILLVHGFTGNPDIWSQAIDGSTLPGPVNSSGRSLQDNLRGLPGAAVYTLDYQSTSARWLTEPGTGGEAFTTAVDCLTTADAFEARQLAVVAHSMGGLIARWAVTAAPGADQRAQRLGPVVTLGTPYEGSWLAAAAHNLLGLLDANTGGLRGLVHLLLRGCRASPDDGCGPLREALEYLATTEAFVPGSPQLRALPEWPPSVQVHTLASRTLLADVGATLFFTSTGQTLDLGDGVVAADSATTGDHPQRIPECEYTASLTRAGFDRLLMTAGQRAAIDTPNYHPLVNLIYSTSTASTCGHSRQHRLIQLTNEVLGIIADAITAAGPAGCPTAEELATLAQERGTGAYDRDEPTMVHPDSILCTEDGWVYARTAFCLSMGSDGCHLWSDGGHTVWRWHNAGWTLEHIGGTGPLCFTDNERERYHHWPTAVRKTLNC